MPRTKMYTEEQHTERLIERCINYIEVAWTQFRRPTMQRTVSAQYATRAKRFCGGMTTIELANRIQSHPAIHCIRHPQGGTYYMPVRAWNELTDEQRSVLMKRILNRTIFHDSAQAGAPALASDGERSVQYFVPSPMEAFLKKS